MTNKQWNLYFALQRWAAREDRKEREEAERQAARIKAEGGMAEGVVIPNVPEGYRTWKVSIQQEIIVESETEGPVRSSIQYDEYERHPMIPNLFRKIRKIR